MAAQSLPSERHGVTSLRHWRLITGSRSGYWEPTIAARPIIGGNCIKYVGMIEYRVTNAAWIEKFQ